MAFQLASKTIHMWLLCWIPHGFMCGPVQLESMLHAQLADCNTGHVYRLCIPPSSDVKGKIRCPSCYPNNEVEDTTEDGASASENSSNVDG